MSNLEEIRKRMKPLSKEAQEERKPLPPEYLVDALQDPIHKNIGNSRPAKLLREKIMVKINLNQKVRVKITKR